MPGYDAIPADIGINNANAHLEDYIINNVFFNPSDSLGGQDIHGDYYFEIPNSEGKTDSSYYGIIIDNEDSHEYYIEISIQQINKLDPKYNDHKYAVILSLYQDKHLYSQDTYFYSQIPDINVLHTLAKQFVNNILGDNAILYNEFY